MSIFTDDDLKKATEHPALGAEYFAARRTAERFMEHFEAEHFKPLAEKMADEFRDKLWSDITDWFLSDTESNLHLAIREIVEGTINALMSGEEWAMKLYPFADFGRAEKVRAKLMEHCGDEVARRHAADLEKEIERLRERLEWARG